MSDESQDKKSTVPDVPLAKSYSTDGGPQISEVSMPQLEPQYLPDVALPKRRGAPTAGGVDVTTQPSLRRVRQATREPNQRRTFVYAVLALLSLVLLWEGAVLARTWLGKRAAKRPEPHTSVQISAAAPPLSTPTLELAAPIEPEQPTGTASAIEVGTATAPGVPETSAPPAAAAEGQPPARARATPAVAAPRAATPSPEVAVIVQREESSPAKPQMPEAPPSEVSAKPQSKVLFPPQ